MLPVPNSRTVSVDVKKHRTRKIEQERTNRFRNTKHSPQFADKDFQETENSGRRDAVDVF